MPADPPPPPLPRLLSALVAEAERGPLERRLLVSPTAGSGREILRAVALRHPRVAGFAVTTPRPLGLQLAASALGAAGLSVMDEFEEEALVHDALDRALGHLPEDDGLHELAEGVGFRRAVRGSVRALRAAGIDADRLRGAGLARTSRGRLMVGTLEGYRVALDERGLADLARVLDAASEALRDGVPLPAQRLLLLPGLPTRGVAGRFVRALLDRGARTLAIDSPPGVPVPSGILWPEMAVEVAPSAESGREGAEARDGESGGSGRDGAPPVADPAFSDLPLFGSTPTVPAPPPPPALPLPLSIFRAAGVSEELREVLRRVRTAGARWDEVEIVTPDPGVYGPALQTLASRLEIPVTYAVGLPVGRTRPGRVVAAWMRWLQEDQPEATIRRLLQAGDLVPDGAEPTDGPRLGRLLRSLRIGWGQGRYLPALDTALERRRGPIEPKRHESVEAARERIEREVEDLVRLRTLLEGVVASAPAGTLKGERVSAARLAAGLGRLLLRVHPDSEVDRSAHERIVRTLDRIEGALTRPTSLASALASVREHLDFRVPAPRTEGRAPWVSDGGALHLSDVTHGGRTGRPHLFLVGMDEHRFPGPDRQDPLLLDGERRLLGPELALGAEATSEARFRLLALVHGARGRLTASWSAWEAAEAREVQPSPILLELHRRGTGDGTAGFEELLDALPPPISRVPREGEPIDEVDLWLRRMAEGGSLADAGEALRRAFPGLDAGLAGREAPLTGVAGPAVGVLAPDPELDPTGPDGPVLSASALEALGRCPLRYFYSRVLRLRPPDDPEFDLDRWLDGRERGLVLHDTFERAVRFAMEGAVEFAAPEFEAETLSILDRRAERARSTVPPPSETAYRREVAGLREDARSWVRLLAEGGLTAAEVEAVEFDLAGEGGPVPIRLPGGRTLRLQGRIDRLDLRADGYRIVDYKTGSTRDYEAKTGVFHGGRRLQHLLYTAAVEALRGEGSVARAGYHFPTVRGENAVHETDRDDLLARLDVLDHLVDAVAAGHFVPTNDPSDCRWCDFRAICRHGSLQIGDDPGNPRVAWVLDRIPGLEPSLHSLFAVRGVEDDR